MSGRTSADLVDDPLILCFVVFETHWRAVRPRHGDVRPLRVDNLCRSVRDSFRRSQQIDGQRLNGRGSLEDFSEPVQNLRLAPAMAF